MDTGTASNAPRVGMVTTATLLAELPELGKMDRKKTLAPHVSAGVASVVGVTPMNYDSGKKRGYSSTLLATRYNPGIRAQYQQLLKRGKEKKVALTACLTSSHRPT